MEGTPFGRYRLVELLGRGGMGEVWRAYDTVTERMVALKVLPTQFGDNREFQKRFRREAHAAAGLNTPHVVPIYDYGEIDGRLFVSMRLIEGRDLHAVLADGPMEPARAVRIIEGVAMALQAAHEVGLVHRDVKPSNILLDRHDFAYLIDFGIARAADETRLTQSGRPPGTFQYIAPERLGTRAEEDARVDIYSLACVLYECLTGHPPFDEDSMAGLVAAHLNTPPPQPSTTQPNVPEQIDQVIATGMAKDPDNRYATTVELANAARDAITVPIPRPIPSPAPNPPMPQAPNPVAAEPTIGEDDSSQPPPGAVASAAMQHRRQQEFLTYEATSAAAASQQAVAAGPSEPTMSADPLRNVVQSVHAIIGAKSPQPTPTRRRWWRRKAIVIPAALVMVAVIAGITVITVISSQRHENSNGPQHREPAYGPQVTLPFTGLNNPNGVAVDTAGDLYVADFGNNRVLKLAAGSSAPDVLPFTGLSHPVGVAVDAAGDLYVADTGNNRVLKLAAGSATPTVLPFTGLSAGVAVDAAGDLYLTDGLNNRVLKLAAGSSTPTVLSFADLNHPYGVAVDSAGDLYVADFGNNRVLKLAAGSSAPTVLPFTGLDHAVGVAVDAAGDLYLTDGLNNRVLKLAAGSSTPTVLPFTGLSVPVGVAVDTAGDLYVVDNRNNRVVQLPPG